MNFWKAHDRLIYLQKSPDQMASEKTIEDGAYMLMNSLQRSISQLDSAIAAEADKNRKKELELKKVSLESALKIRKSPIESPKQLEDAIDQIKYDEFLLGRIGEGSFDQIDLDFLMNSDLFPFFDEASQGQLAASFEQMHTNDEAKTLLSKPGSIHLEEYPGTPKHRQLVGLPQLLSVVSPDVIHKIKLTLQEAQFIRTDRIKAYLKADFKEFNQQIEEARKGGAFTGETIDKMAAELLEAKQLLIDQNSDPKLLAKTAKNMRAARLTLKTSRKEMEELKANRPQLEAKVRADYDRLKTLLVSLDKDKIQDLLQRHQAQGSAGPANLKKASMALGQLVDPNSELQQHVAEFEGRLGKLDEMPPEELIVVRNDLNTLTPKLQYLQNLDANMAEALDGDNIDAKKAHNTIKELDRLQDPSQLREVLEKNLGTEHLEFVSHDVFENQYRQYTEQGHMVFYERGDQWKIILDESALDGENLETLKKQLVHELLHLEFEKGKNVKEQVRRELVEGQPEQWQKIRTAFIKMAESNNKQPPHGEIWEDDDILSELYAMQREIGQFYTKGKSPKDKLNNLLVAAGLGKALDVSAKTEEYEKGAKEKIRGYEAGVEAGEEARKPGSWGDTKETQSKEQAVYIKNKGQIDHIAERLKEIKKSEHIGLVPGATGLVNAMEGFNDATAGLNEDLLKEKEGDILEVAIEARNAQISGDLNEVEEKVAKASRNAPNNEIGLFRKLWINTIFMSPEDFVQMGRDVFEFFQRRHKRKNADHAARLGMAFFHGTDVGREARARQEKAEAEEVNEWKSRYENLDAWALEEELTSLANSLDPSPDQLRAILRILAEKGRFNIQNQDLWRIINKLQTAVVLKPGDQILMHNPILLRQKLHHALGEIYDYDEFTTLIRSNEGAYQSEKGKYDTENNRTQNSLTERLDELLTQARTGEKVDPMQYESILEYCIKNGKSYAENVMFHLIAGMAEGLLAPDRGLALGEHLNNWPSVDWFTALSPPMTTADWKRYAMENFKRDFVRGSISVDGYGGDFQNWYWTTVQNTPRVVERVKKSVSERVWDHDWGRSIACLGDADTAKRFLAGRSGQQETKATAVGNAYVGAVQWLEENAKNPEFANKENFARMAGWIAMSEGILYGTAYNRAESDTSTRENESMNNDIPREAGVGRHGNASTKEHRQICENFLFMIDPNFFGMLSGQEARSKEAKQQLGQQARDYLIQAYPELADELGQVEEIGQVYNRLDLIVSTMFKHISEEQFQAILLQIVAAREG